MLNAHVDNPEKNTRFFLSGPRVLSPRSLGIAVKKLQKLEFPMDFEKAIFNVNGQPRPLPCSGAARLFL